jgi:hypothetical protein
MPSKAITRAGVALLYAHWEGFVKNCAESYLEYVCMQRLRNEELCDAIMSVAVRAKLNRASYSRKIAAHIDVVKFLRDEMQKRSNVPYKNAIRTDSNLSSTVLFDILATIGIDARDYQTKAHLLDNQLLARRNHIAHGEELDVDQDEYLRLHSEVSVLMNNLRNQIENAAVSGNYKKSVD